jgi:hypothetical protein
MLYAIKLNHYVAEDISLVLDSFFVVNFSSNKRNNHEDHQSIVELTQRPLASNNDKDSWENSEQTNLYVIPAYLLTVKEIIGWYSETIC